MKIMLEVNGVPKGNDVLVYNAQNQSYECVDKEIFLTNVYKKINNVDKKVEKNYNKIAELSKDLSTIAKILKEKL